MSTALELVNRIRAKRRDATSTIITDRQGVAYLDFLNSAITSILEERTWNFQLRSDGTLTTVPLSTGTDGAVQNGFTGFGSASFAGVLSPVYGDFQARIAITDDASYGSTSVRVDTAHVAGAMLTGAMSTAWFGASNFGSADFTFFVYEYVLPSTVRSVTNVSHQESDLSLFFEDGQYTFDRLVPSPLDSTSDTPQIVMVGGEIQRTAETGLTGEFGLGLRIYPVPESALALNYSYVYRQPKLTVSTSELYRVPGAVEDLIVELATARVISSLEKDVQTGLPLEVRVNREIDKIHRNHAADSGRRNPMRSLDHIGRTTGPAWPPRSVPGLAGS